jgi:hypothetical protein
VLVVHLLCRVGWHRWVKRRYEDSGEAYMKCSRCGKETDVGVRPPANPLM